MRVVETGFGVERQKTSKRKRSWRAGAGRRPATGGVLRVMEKGRVKDPKRKLLPRVVAMACEEVKAWLVVGISRGGEKKRSGGGVTLHMRLC